MKSPRQEASLLSWFFFGPALFLSWVTGIDETAPWLPFIISIPLIGLSHGAADWVLLRPKTRKKSTVVFLLYAMVGAITGIIAWAFPLPTVAAFFLLTTIHFGMGDERDLRSFGDRYTPRLPERFSGVFRVAAFLGLVCWIDAESVALLFGSVSRMLGDPVEGFFPVDLFQRSSGIFFVIVLGAWILCLFRQSIGSKASRVSLNGRPLVEIMEGVALLICGLTLNAIYAIGLYFLCWHAFRHLILVSSYPNEKSDPRSLFRAIFLLHLKSWPLLVPTVPLMVGLIWLNGNLASPLHWVASFLVVCIVFTLPHHLIVERFLIEMRLETENQPKDDIRLHGEKTNTESFVEKSNSVFPSS